MRYIAQSIGNDACQIIDTEANKWNMPTKAVSMNVREISAIQIVKILNEEWEEFNRNPS